MYYIQRNRTQILLVLIVLIAFYMRGYRLGEIPSFHTDEADYAHNAYSILSTGKDQTGRYFPITTSSTGDERPAVYVYLAILPVWLLGFSELAVRVPSLIFGTATLVVMYLLAIEIFKNKNVALLSCVVLAISFWHITISREASEKTVALFTVMLGIFFLLRYFNTSKIYWFFLSLILFLTSIYTYYSPRLFLVLFLPFVWLIMRVKVSKKNQLISGGILILLLCFIMYITLFLGRNQERVNQLLIFNHPYTKAILDEQLAEDGQTSTIFVSRMFHNKLVNYGFTFFNNYLSHYSPQYLFVEGGEPKRVQIPQVGLINPIELPFLLVGFYLLILKIQKEKKMELLILPIWILISGIPSALTFDEVPNVYRTSLAIPAYVAIISLGIWTIFSYRKIVRKPFVLGIVLIGYIWFQGYFLHQYFVHFEKHRPIYRNYAQKELGTRLKDSKDLYDTVFVTKAYGGTEQILRFYLKYNPVKYMQEGYPKDKDYTGLSNIMFVPDNCPFPVLYKKLQLDISKRYLFINSHDCVINPTFSYKFINWKDGNRAYSIVDSTEIKSEALLELKRKD